MADEELATYIDGRESKRASTAPSLARIEYARRSPNKNGGFEEPPSGDYGVRPRDEAARPHAFVAGRSEGSNCSRARANS